MYSKYRTLSDVLTLANTTIDIPRDAVVDQIAVKFNVTVKNTGTEAFETVNEKILRAIEEIRVISDGTAVHYSLSAADAAILNVYNSKHGFAPNLDESISVGAGAEKTFEYFIRLDEGDILAASKDNLEMKLVVNPNLGNNVTIDVLRGEVSIVENVLTPQELIATYGANLEFAAEPKVYALTAGVVASSEITNILDLPTGALSRAAVLQFTDKGLAGGVDPAKVGLVVTSPDRRELLNIDWATLRALNASEYDVAGVAPAGVAYVNYAKDVTSDGYGLRAWRFTKGDYQVVAKTANPAVLRYIALEHVVNAGVFDTADRAQLELTR